MNILRTWVTAVAVFGCAGVANSAPLFQGRLAQGMASATCTVSGTDKCAMFYNTTLDITILNDWNIGFGFWSASAVEGSAQALAESAGAAQTGFTGWFLPTGAGNSVVGALNQYQSLWNDVGASFAGLEAQFDGVQNATYWSSSEIPDVTQAWNFDTLAGKGGAPQANRLFAVAVRPGDVAASVPEPQTLALTLFALGAVVVARRRRPNS